MRTGHKSKMVLIYRALFTLSVLGGIATIVMGVIAIWSSGIEGSRWASTAALCFFTSMAVLVCAWSTWMTESDRW